MKQYLSETLRLLYWTFFKPRTLDRYVKSLDSVLVSWQPELDVRHELRVNHALLRLVIQGLLLIVSVTTVVNLLIGLTVSAWGGETNWSGIAEGIAWGIAVLAGATQRHPYLVQLVCAAVVRHINRRIRAEERALHATPLRAEMADVNAALEAALDDGEIYFTHIWQCDTGETAEEVAAGQRILTEIAAHVGAGLKPAPTQGKTSRVALRRLVRRGILEETEAGYQFQVPLVRQWVCQRVS